MEINKSKIFLRMVNAAPFETMFATYSFYAGTAGLFNFGLTPSIFEQVVGPIVALIFNVAYAIAGLSMFFGLWLARKEIESFGLIVVMTSALIRQIAVGYVAGFSSVIFSGYVFAAIFIAACSIRLRQLKNIVIIEKAINQKVVSNG